MADPYKFNTLVDGCGFDYSVDARCDRLLYPHEISIKYVVKGAEYYELNGAGFHVSSGQYLVTNARKTARVIIDAAEPVKGLCVALTADMLRQSASYISNEEVSRKTLLDFLHAPHFFNHVYSSENSHLGSCISNLRHQVESGSISNSFITAEAMFTIADEFFNDQSAHFRALSGIHAAKAATRNDLYKRLLQARHYITDNLAADIRMEDTASIAHLSQYHFYRLFRAAFQCTPYQFLQQQRILQARRLLCSGHSVTDTALRSGFTDVFTFSKAFKKKTGLAPTDFLLQRS
jgi:AraC family transcriptional regulator